jgi:phage terminase small subunit
MPRQRDPRRDEAFEIWKQHNGNITNRAIAEQLGVPEKTISAWKSRDKWDEKLKGIDCSTAKNECSTTNKKTTKKSRSPDVKETEGLIVESNELTEKQRLFCLYYLKYFNATKAYQKAYGCDYKTANVNGSRMLVKASIKKEIERLKAEQQQALFLEAKDVLQKYIDIAFADITDYVSFGQETVEEINEVTGQPESYVRNFVRFKNSSEVDGTIITEVKKGKDGVSIKLADKMKALEKLWEYFDMLPDTYKRKLLEEKTKAETEFIQERTKQLKGAAKDTSLLEALIDAVKGDGS